MTSMKKRPSNDSINIVHFIFSSLSKAILKGITQHEKQSINVIMTSQWSLYLLSSYIIHFFLTTTLESFRENCESLEVFFFLTDAHACFEPSPCSCSCSWSSSWECEWEWDFSWLWWWLCSSIEWLWFEFEWDSLPLSSWLSLSWDFSSGYSIIIGSRKVLLRLLNTT